MSTMSCPRGHTAANCDCWREPASLRDLRRAITRAIRRWWR